MAISNEAKKYYERLYDKKWADMNEKEREQFEKREMDKLPVKGEKRLPKVVYNYHLFPKKPKNF
jgi:hypothetical protein